MIHSFKKCGNRYIYDSGSGSLHLCDELTVKMLDYIELPMKKECPSALRYDLAKYDSEAVSSSYSRLYELYSEGLIFSEDNAECCETPSSLSRGAVLVLKNGEKCCHSHPFIKDVNGSASDCAGLVISDCGDDSLDEEDIGFVARECDKLSKELAHLGEKGLFAPVKVFEHKFVQCKNCFARRICSLQCPGEIICKLERVRAECQLAEKVKG